MDIAQQLEENTDAFITLIKNFPDQFFNSKPTTEDWSAAEIAEHMIRSEFGLSRLFDGETKEQLEYDPLEMRNNIKTTLLNRKTKVLAPEIIQPTTGEKTKDDLISKFKTIRDNLLTNIKTMDNQAICLKYPHPLFGYLTRADWVYSSIYHCQRHIMQVNDILTQINK